MSYLLLNAIKNWKFHLKMFIKRQNKASIKLFFYGVIGYFKKFDGFDQKRLLEEYDWDILIVLDACRYNYFATEYKDFLRGKLLKLIF